MVKFAEAEKRGRGGEGSDRRYAPLVMLERPKMSRAMWESLKGHIMMARKRKKEEQEADEEEERMRKEIENRKKQQAMTLEETREKISQKELELADLKKQKHQLFQDLKVVLNEDATRKRQQQQQNYLKENEMMDEHPYPHGSISKDGHPQMLFQLRNDMVAVHPYPHGTMPMGTHPQMLFQSGIASGRPQGPPTMYKVGVSQQPLINPGSLKRSRSPSPPATYAPQLQYNFKNIHQQQTSVPVSIPNSKSSGGAGSVYVTAQGPYYHGTIHGSSHAPSHGSNNQFATHNPATQQQAYLPSNPGNPPSQQPSSQNREDKHLANVFMHAPRGPHVSTIHKNHENKGKPANFQPGNEAVSQDKFYPRTTLSLHPGVLPVQQQQPGANKGGSITSGFPAVRGAPPVSSQPPSPAVSSAPHYTSQQQYSRQYY